MSDVSRGVVAGLQRTRKVRPGQEVLTERVFRPLAQSLVGPLARAGVRPEQVVVFHTLLGVLAAALVARGERVAPAVLLQVKTLLDNADGQLARATGQTSEVGRYLDTEMDTVVNAALLLAIDRRVWPVALALLQLILTADFLLEREYRAARGEVFRDAAAQPGDARLLRALRAVYEVLFVPQERLLGAVFDGRFRALGSRADREAYAPRWATHVAANLGLSTQLALAGALISAGRPRAYLASLPLQALLLVGVQVLRERQALRERGGGA